MKWLTNRDEFYGDLRSLSLGETMIVDLNKFKISMSEIRRRASVANYGRESSDRFKYRIVHDKIANFVALVKISSRPGELKKRPYLFPKDRFQLNNMELGEVKLIPLDSNKPTLEKLKNCIRNQIGTIRKSQERLNTATPPKKFITKEASSGEGIWVTRYE